MSESVQSAPAFASLPRVIPIFPLAGALLLPRGRLPLNIFEPRYLAMIDDALRHSRVIGMIQPSDPSARVPPLYPVGCLGRLTEWAETGDGRFHIALTGLIRFRIGRELQTTTHYRQIEAVYDPFASDLEPQSEDGIDRERLGHCLMTYLKQRDVGESWETLEQVPCEVLINYMSMICPFEVAEKQALLEAPQLADRARLLTMLIEMTAAGGGSHGGTLQ